MSKEEFVTELMKNKDILEIKSTEQASMIFDYFIHILKNKLQHLEEGEYFRLHKIGSFYPLYLKSRTVRNPRTCERVQLLQAKKYVSNPTFHLVNITESSALIPFYNNILF